MKSAATRRGRDTIRPARPAVSACQSARHSLGKLQDEGTLCRVAVVVAAFIDNTDIPMTGGFLVGHYHI